MKSTARVNEIRQGDCVKLLAAMPEGCVDLAFADPPFNIGYEYDVYHDKKEAPDYLAWSRDWIAAVHRVLKPAGTFWLAIGDEYAAELKLASQQIGFTCRSWVIWYYTFGVNCKQKFSRSHAHLFYFVKDPKNFTFRADELENRIPSARQLVYADKRANSTGRLPDDTWVLRPQDLADCFTPAEDMWYFPRVAGTFKERAGFHGCQMPEQLLGRIIRLCSHQRDVVLDPFSGSATTLAVAKKLGRCWLGFDLSEEYVQRGRARLDSVCLGDQLDGAPEPTMSAPATPKVPVPHRRVQQPKATAARARAVERSAWRPPAASDKCAERKPGASVPVVAADDAQSNARAYRDGLLAAFTASYEQFSLDRVVADPALNATLGDACTRLGLPGDRRSWNMSLFRMRKAGLLAHLPAPRRTEFTWEACDPYSFASEIAWRHLIDEGHESLDTILCDPALAAEFDTIAARWAPGFTSLEYRWAALKLRKKAKAVRARAKLLADAALGHSLSLDAPRKFPQKPGVYVILGTPSGALYAGETRDLRARMHYIAEETREPWRALSISLAARIFPTDCTCETRLGYQRRLVVEHEPALNLIDLKVA